MAPFVTSKLTIVLAVCFLAAFGLAGDVVGKTGLDGVDNYAAVDEFPVEPRHAFLNHPILPRADFATVTVTVTESVCEPETTAPAPSSTEPEPSSTVPATSTEAPPTPTASHPTEKPTITVVPSHTPSSSSASHTSSAGSSETGTTTAPPSATSTPPLSNAAIRQRGVPPAVLALVAVLTNFLTI